MLAQDHVPLCHSCARGRVSFGQMFLLVRVTTNSVAHDAAPEATMTERMHIAGDVVRARQRTSECRSRWRKARHDIRMAAENDRAICWVGYNRHTCEGVCLP